MKLLTKVNRSYAFFSLVVLLLGTALLYFFIKHYITFETAEKLESTKQRVIKSINDGKPVEFEPFIEVHLIPGADISSLHDEVKDTMFTKAKDGSNDAFVELKTYYQRGDSVFAIIIRSDNLEESDLLFSIGGPALVALLLILIISNVVMSRINKLVWNPFYRNLHTLKNFSITDSLPLNLIGSNIQEFKDLNQSLLELTEKLQYDYKSQKEFSENVSHELQTPMAIINAKIEALLQHEYADPETVHQLQTIYKTVTRLSRLNKSLILLSKLESREYEEKKEIRVKEFLENSIADFAEIVKTKGITLETEFADECTISMNEDLFGIVVSNLLINAVRYTTTGGQIMITLENELLTIKNTGVPPKRDPIKMFERFAKSSHSNESSGLGLTIAKQICDLNKFAITYVYANELHIITISFTRR